MRIQIILNFEVREAAEKRAQDRGFASLPAYLKVVATELAREAPGPVDAETKADTTTKPAAPKIPVKQTVKKVRRYRLGTVLTEEEIDNLPDPAQFTKWPNYIPRDINETDPDYYNLMIEVGQIA